MGNNLRRIGLWLKLRAWRRERLEKGSLSYVLKKARLEMASKERQIILTGQAVHNPKPGFFIPVLNKIMAGFLVFVFLVTSLSLVRFDSASGATFTFVQTDWAGGTDGGVYPVHPTNQAGWNKYFSKDAAATAAAGNLALTLTNGSTTHTLDADFNGGTKTNVSVGGGNVRLSTSSTEYSWVQGAITTPSYRYGASIEYDAVAGKFYIFGGLGGVYKDDTYSFDPVNLVYQELNPGGTLQNPRERHASAWDSTNRKMYVAGGFFTGAGGTNADTWVYNPVPNTWTKLNSTSPIGGVNDPKMVYDPINQKIYAIGLGNNQLWGYTIATNTWAEIIPAVGVIPTIISPVAEWDTQNNKMWVSAGNPATLYSYTPSTNTWAAVSPTGTVPCLSQANGAWDNVNNKLWIFGGISCSSSAVVNTLYSYTPSTNVFTQVTYSGTVTARDIFGMAFGAGKVYIYGGQNLDEDNLYDPATNAWTAVTPVTMQPSGSWSAPGTWDTQNNKFWVFGGHDGIAVFNGLWSYSASTGTWTQASPIGSPPSARSSHSAAWDGANNKIWIFGGCQQAGCTSFYNDLWSYTPSTNTWTQASPIGSPPSARSRNSAAWDGINNKMWVFGGYDGVYKNDLWSYTPSTNTWAQASPIGGPPGLRSGATLNWNSGDVLYLMGGNNETSSLSDLWTYTISTNTWALLSPTGTPSDRNGHNAFWDSPKNRLVIFGGYTTGGFYLNTSWSYTPSTNTWAQINFVESLPGGRTNAAADFDANSNKMYLFSGQNPSNLLGTYILTMGDSYLASGDLISSTIDTGQGSNFGNLNWTASIPANTALRFQLRSATTSGGLTSATWYGPTGTGDYYTASGTAINSVHSGNRWIQYRAYFSNTNSFVTPTLNDITINFSYYPASAMLTGSAYNTADTNNILARIQWTENLPAGTDVKFQVRTTKDNGGTPNTIGDYMYAFSTGTNFYRYSISGNLWSTMASPPLSSGDGSGLVFTGGDYLYTVLGGTNFYRYSISGNSWSSMAAIPGAAGWGGSLLHTGGDYIYALRGNTTTDFYRYSISGNSWTSLASTPATIYYGGSLAYTGNGDYIYALRGNATTDFYRYSISGNSWSTMASAPAATVFHAGGRVVYPGTGDYLYATAGGITTTFLRYSISANSWSTMASAPASFYSGGTLASPGGGDYIYGTPGETTGSTVFLRYSISANSWSTMASLPTIAHNGAQLSGSLGWTSWMGPDGTSSTYFTDPSGGEIMPAAVTSGNNDQWIQYKAYLSATDTSKTPTLSDVTLSYVVNGPPSVTNVTASQGSSGVMTVGYDLADADSANATVALAASFGATLATGINSSVTTLDVSSAANLPAAGSVFIDNEEIQYGSKSGNTLNGLTRGKNNSVAATHSSGASVFFKAAAVSGNVGALITPGTGKSISWTVATDLTNVSTATGQVKVFANDGNLANQLGIGSISNITIDTAAPTTVLTSGSLVRASATSPTAMSITWTTNENSNSFVDYGNTTAYGTTASNAAMTTSHSVAITGLTASTTYYYRIRSTDAYNNTLTDDNAGASYTFTTPASDARAPVAPDTTPPVITNVLVTNIATNGATITWTTDENASSIVNYGLNNTYGSLAGVPDIFTVTHSVSISGLVPSTIYNYQVVSLDQSSNRSATANATFTTVAATGAGLSPEASALEKRIIELTNANAALKARISELEAQLGGTLTREQAGRILRDLENLRLEIENNLKQISELSKFKDKFDALETENKSLRQQLSDITNKILGIKEGDKLSPQDLLKVVQAKFAEITRIFKSSATVEQKQALEGQIGETAATLRDLSELVPPAQILTRPGVIVGATEATVTWSTDKPTLGAVQFSDSDTYKPEQYASNIADGSSFKTEHRVTLQNLIPATLYHYQIKVKTEADVESASSDFTFTTKNAVPVISAVRFSRVDEKTISFAWLTSMPADSVVTYTPYVNGAPAAKQAKSEGSPEFSKDHSVTVGGLLPATTYDITVSSSDAFGNTVSERLGRIITSEDKVAPNISQVRTEITVVPGSRVNKVQAIVSWKTDEPATTQVIYDRGPSNSDSFKESSNASAELTFNHIAVITNWEPGTIYRFRTISADESGNEAQSKTFTVLTPKQKATVVDLIINNFSDIFGWTKGIK